MKFVTCASQESSPQIKNSSSQEVCQVWNQSPKASLQGEDLHPLNGSLRKLLDIGNAIHPKHQNPNLALSLHPKYCLHKTFSHFGRLRFVAILYTFFKKRRRYFSKQYQSINVQIKHQIMKICVLKYMHLLRALLWGKSCWSEVVVPYQG